jgi:hypothetical protein
MQLVPGKTQLRPRRWLVPLNIRRTRSQSASDLVAWCRPHSEASVTVAIQSNGDEQSFCEQKADSVGIWDTHDRRCARTLAMKRNRRPALLLSSLVDNAAEGKTFVQNLNLVNIQFFSAYRQAALRCSAYRNCERS